MKRFIVIAVLALIGMSAHAQSFEQVVAQWKAEWEEVSADYVRRVKASCSLGDANAR